MFERLIERFSNNPKRAETILFEATEMRFKGVHIKSLWQAPSHKKKTSNHWKHSLDSRVFKHKKPKKGLPAVPCRLVRPMSFGSAPPSELKTPSGTFEQR